MRDHVCMGWVCWCIGYGDFEGRGILEGVLDVIVGCSGLCTKSDGRGGVVRG